MSKKKKRRITPFDVGYVLFGWRITRRIWDRRLWVLQCTGCGRGFVATDAQVAAVKPCLRCFSEDSMMIDATTGYPKWTTKPDNAVDMSRPNWKPKYTTTTKGDTDDA